MFRRVRTVGLIALAIAYVALGWVAGLALILWWLFATVRAFVRARRALATFTRCPRDHVVAQYGVFRCACGAVTESWIWVCPVCSQESGFTDCGQCGLAVPNPRLG